MSDVKKIDNSPVLVVACLAEILGRVVERLSAEPLSDKDKVAKVTAAINPVAVGGDK